MTGADLPLIMTQVPGPLSRARVDVLAKHECPAVTARRARRASALGAAHDDPIVYAEALGANVWDVDGNRFVDLAAGYAVAFVGHRHPAVVAAAHAQANRLVHAMGDTFPDTTRIALLERLAEVTPGGLDVSIFGLSGSDSVEAAVKTALLATGRPGVVSFNASYHGLTLGALPLQGYKAAFTDAFRPLVSKHVQQLPFGCPPEELGEVLARSEVGLVIVEPVLGRGGMLPAPPGWLAAVADMTRAAGALLCFDEIQCGLGRTGT